MPEMTALFPETCALISPVANPDLVWTEEINFRGSPDLVARHVPQLDRRFC
jgi:hypothetical protein